MVAESKTLLRKEMLAKRNALSEAERKEWSKKIGQRLFALDEYKNAKTIAFYLPIRSEVDTRSMIERAINDGKEVLVPVTNDETKLEFVNFFSFDDLAPGKYGILEPKTRQDAGLQDPRHETQDTKLKTLDSRHEAPTPDIVILPGLAFDLDLHRLGYGKGYYDRALKKLPNAIRIGICFDCQIIDKTPRHEHDERLHIIVTEKRIVLY